MPEKSFHFIYDNDFFAATDRYYTQGIILKFIHPAISKSFINKILPGFSSGHNQYGIQVEQDVFTPRSIRYMGGAVYQHERPFTAVFFASQFRQSFLDAQKLALCNQIDVGILGPAALGEEEQKGIHKALNNIQPQGWDNQLSPDLVFNYRTTVEKVLIGVPHFEFSGSFIGRVGTLYTDGSVGLNIRAGFFRSQFAQTASLAKQNFQAHIILKGSSRFVGYNASLQGGMFNSGNVYELSDNEITRIIGAATLGCVIGFKKILVEYSRTFITKEFEEGLEHSWGRCAVSLYL